MTEDSGLDSEFLEIVALKSSDDEETKCTIKDKGLLSSIRHSIKNNLNFLALCEYEYYGTNDMIINISKLVDKLISEEYINDKILLRIDTD